MSEVYSKGWQNWLNEQLDPASVPDPGGDDVRALYPELGWDIPTTRANIDEFSWDSMHATACGTLALATWSQRQLFEAMVDFWSNHLNVTCPSDGVWDNRADYDRTVIRRYAMGKFSDMLAASAVHPAMLNYLNNNTSTKTQPNENYGRELLELHTVGVDAGYTEAEVLSSARIMTGWSTDGAGLAIYRSTWHWKGTVSAMGFSHANASSDGRAVVTAYLSHLAHHQRTATRLATKLCERFVSDTPPAGLVSRLANIYLNNDTAIVPVLRELFTSNEFWTSQGVKIRRPYEDLVATVRTLGHQILPASRGASARRHGVQALYWTAAEMRQPPLQWGLPTGYPDEASAWRSADIAVSRFNSHRNIAETWWPGSDDLAVVPPATFLPNPLPANYGDLVDRVAIRLVYNPLPTAQRNAVLAFFGKSASSALSANHEVVRWRAGALASLILNTPEHAVR